MPSHRTRSKGRSSPAPTTTTPASYTAEQIVRALSFVDISGDDIVTSSELRGSLLSTSMHASHSNELAALLLQNDNVDHLNRDVNIEQVRTRLSNLITSNNNERNRALAERAIVEAFEIERSKLVWLPLYE